MQSEYVNHAHAISGVLHLSKVHVAQKEGMLRKVLFVQKEAG